MTNMEPVHPTLMTVRSAKKHRNRFCRPSDCLTLPKETIADLPENQLYHGSPENHRAAGICGSRMATLIFLLTLWNKEVSPALEKSKRGLEGQAENLESIPVDMINLLNPEIPSWVDRDSAATWQEMS